MCAQITQQVEAVVVIQHLFSIQEMRRSVCREIVLLWHQFFIVSFSHSLVLQRSGTRRRYQDDGISDDEIDGKRTFDLEEKLHNTRFNSDRIKRMEGKGEKEMHYGTLQQS